MGRLSHIEMALASQSSLLQALLNRSLAPVAYAAAASSAPATWTPSSGPQFSWNTEAPAFAPVSVTFRTRPLCLGGEGAGDAREAAPAACENAPEGSLQQGEDRFPPMPFLTQAEVHVCASASRFHDDLLLELKGTGFEDSRAGGKRFEGDSAEGTSFEDNRTGGQRFEGGSAEGAGFEGDSVSRPPAGDNGSSTVRAGFKGDCFGRYSFKDHYPEDAYSDKVEEDEGSEEEEEPFWFLQAFDRRWANRMVSAISGESEVEPAADDALIVKIGRVTLRVLRTAHPEASDSLLAVSVVRVLDYEGRENDYLYRAANDPRGISEKYLLWLTESARKALQMSRDAESADLWPLRP